MIRSRAVPVSSSFWHREKLASARWVVGLSLASALLGGGCYEFSRAASLLPGTVSGTAFRDDDGQAAVFARVAATGTPLTHRADGLGAFRLSGLPRGPVVVRIVDDSDGDGRVNRAASVATLLREGVPPGTVAGVQLGRVPLRGTMAVRGSVFVDDGAGGSVAPAALGLSARVLVTRGQCFAFGDEDDTNVTIAAPVSDCGADDPVRVEAGADAATGVDDSGAFQIDAVESGQIEVVVLLFTGDGANLVGLRDVAGPVVVTGQAGQTVQLPEAVLFPADAPALGTGAVDVQTNPPASADAYALVSPPGQAPPPCRSDRPAAEPDFPLAQLLSTTFGGGTVRLTLPVGAWELFVCDGARRGQSGEQVVLPSEGGDTAPVWAVTMIDGDPCAADVAGERVRDCDGDGLVGLPPYDGAPPAAWVSCGLVCATGDAVADLAQSADRRCTVDAVVYDCDDDNDGQPDTTEPLACYGVGRGTDLDGDGLCTGSDPFPQCAQNSAAACVPGTNDVSFGALDDADGSWRLGPPLPAGFAAGTTLEDYAQLLTFTEAGTPSLLLVSARDPDGALTQPFVLSPASATSTWTQLATPLVPRAGMLAVPRFDTSAVLLGGADESTTEPSGELFDVFLSAGTFEVFLSSLFYHGGPVAFGSFSAVVPVGGLEEDVSHVVSGGTTTDGVFVNALYAMNDSGLAGFADFVQERTLTPARKHHAAAAIAVDLGAGLVHRHAIFGGIDDATTLLAEARYIDVVPTVPRSASELLTLPPLSVTRHLATATVLLDDDGQPTTQVLVAGGRAVPNDFPNSQIDVYELGVDPPVFIELNLMRVSRVHHTATALPGGRVVITGGLDPAGNALRDVEIYEPGGQPPRVLAPMQIARAHHVAALVDGEVIVVGGVDSEGGAPTNTAEILTLP